MNGTFLADIAAVFAVGLFSSLHCIGMCGPLATVGCRSTISKPNRWRPLLFSIGKLGSYSLLGLAAGLVGSTLLSQVSMLHTAAYVSIFGGVFMIVVLVLIRFNALSLGILSKTASAISKRALRYGTKAPFLLGTAAAFLPCGVLFVVVARSAAAHDPVKSMFLMQAFGLGTMPALVGLGTLLQWVPQRWSRYGNTISTTVLILTACILIWRGVAGLGAEGGAPSCCP